MPRQRVRERTSPLIILGRLVTLLFALALIWYGLMTLLLALKVSPSTVNSISGYRTAFDWLSGLSPTKVDGAVTRGIVAGAGVLAFLVFGYLALKQLPRPYLARRTLDLTSDERGEVTVEPRAIERVAALAVRARHEHSAHALIGEQTIRPARRTGLVIGVRVHRQKCQSHESPPKRSAWSPFAA